MIIVSDASPIIFLLKLKRLDILRNLYKTKILLPKEVHDEICKKLENYELSYLNSFKDLFETVTVEGSLNITKLDEGENKVIFIAKNKNALVIIDDKQGRIICEQIGLKVIGTIGVLYKSLKEGILTKKEFISLIDDLIQKYNFRISIELYNSIMREINK